MGGLGSGRFGKKVTTEDSYLLDVGVLVREGFVRPGHRGGGTTQWRNLRRVKPIKLIFVVETHEHGGSMRLAYIPPFGTKPVRMSVTLITTFPHCGGLRWWFVCPLPGHSRTSGRRCTKLCLPISKRAHYWGCRSCYGLTYRSQKEDFGARARRRVSKLERRLQAEPDSMEIPEKPKGMHWRTYHRLIEELEIADEDTLVPLARAAQFITPSSGVNR